MLFRSCRATLEELRRVVARAKALEDRAPKADLWAGVAKRIGSGQVVDIRSRRRFSFSVPQLIAASIALILLSGSGMWLALRSRQTATRTPRPDAEWQVLNVSTRRTDAAIADLQEVFERNKSRLDTSTVRVVQQAFTTIDQAIAEARAALEADPGNAYLNLHLADTMRRKLELLRRVNAIAAAQS